MYAHIHILSKFIKFQDIMLFLDMLDNYFSHAWKDYGVSQKN